MIFFFLDFFKCFNDIYNYLFVPNKGIIWWPLEYNRPRAWFLFQDNFYDDIPSWAVANIMNNNPDLPVYMIRKNCVNYTTYLESNNLFKTCNNSNRMILILDQHYCGPSQNYLEKKLSFFLAASQRADWEETYIRNSLEREIVTSFIEIDV